MKRVRFILSAAVIILASGFQAYAHEGEHPSASAEASDAVVLVEEDIAYEPEEMSVKIGQTIRVENRDPFEHKSRVTRKFNDGSLGKIVVKDHTEKQKSSFTFTFTEAGTYEIRCMLHDGMVATLHVTR